MTPLFHLPDELLVQIIGYLRAIDIIRVQQTCLRLLSVVQSHAALQYEIELYATGMVDNPTSPLVVGDKLRSLRDKEAAWQQLDLSNPVTLPTKHNTSGIYDLTGGVLLLGERLRPDIQAGTDNVFTVDLRSVFDQHEEEARVKLWKKISLCKQVIDVGLAIQEHDLIAIVTYTYVNLVQLWASVDIHLIKHSTGQPHPAAAKPVIHVENTHYVPNHCSLMLEVSGDTLAFLLINYFHRAKNPATLTVYNWKTGRPRGRRSLPDPGILNSFILLDPDTIAVPDTLGHVIEISRLGPEPPSSTSQSSEDDDEDDDEDEDDESVFSLIPPIESFCRLKLPEIADQAIVLRMTSRCEPNPRAPSSGFAVGSHARAPFAADPTTALMILHLAIRVPSGVTRMYTLLVHRVTLLQYLNSAIDAAAHFSAIPDEGARFSNWTFEPSLAFAPSDPTPTLAWKVWGPPVGRWFDDEHAFTRWITTTCGQRFVRIHGPDLHRGPGDEDDDEDEHEHEDKGAQGGERWLHVYDFNPRTLRRHLAMRELAGEPVGTRRGEEILREDEHQLTCVEEELMNDPGAEQGIWDALMDAGEGEGEGAGADSDVDLVENDTQQAPVQPMPGAWNRGSPTTADSPIVADSTTPDPSTPDRIMVEEPELTRKVNVVLGASVILDDQAWGEPLVSRLPYIETSVRTTGDYESALIDEDIIVGLRMDSTQRRIKEVILHRMGN